MNGKKETGKDACLLFSPKNKKLLQKGSSVVERVMGIEPTYSAWEADVLPLNYTRVGHYYIQSKIRFQVSISHH